MKNFALLILFVTSIVHAQENHRGTILVERFADGTRGEPILVEKSATSIRRESSSDGQNGIWDYLSTVPAYSWTMNLNTWIPENSFSPAVGPGIRAGRDSKKSPVPFSFGIEGRLLTGYIGAAPTVGIYLSITPVNWRDFKPFYIYGHLYEAYSVRFKTIEDASQLTGVGAGLGVDFDKLEGFDSNKKRSMPVYGEFGFDTLFGFKSNSNQNNLRLPLTLSGMFGVKF